MRLFAVSFVAFVVVGVLALRHPVAEKAAPPLKIPPKVMVLGQPAPPPDFEAIPLPEIEDVSPDLDSVPNPKDEADKLNAELKAAHEKVKDLDFDSLVALSDWHCKNCEVCDGEDEPEICVEHYVVLKEIFSRPESKTLKQGAPPFVDPDLVKKPDLDRVEKKIDQLTGLVGQTLSLAKSSSSVPTAEAIADRVADKVVDKIVDGVTNKVVDKITSAILKFQTPDGKTRTEVVKASAVKGSEEIVLNPGEVLTHIDGKPVAPTAALPAFNSGWVQRGSPIYQNQSYQVQGIGKNRVRLAPMAPSTCRTVNGVTVCN